MTRLPVAAGGRTLHNKVRQAEAMVRTVEVLLLFKERGFGRGMQAQNARELGVHRSTIGRDIRKIFWPDGAACPTCERDWRLK